MVAIPFAFFAALLVFWWYKHQRVDVCIYMMALYAVTGLCAVLMVANDIIDTSGVLFDRYDLELGFIPTMMFCLLLSLGVLPFSMLYGRDLKTITNPCPRLLDVVSWVLILAAFVNFYLVYDSTLDILNGNLEAVRHAHYEGIENPAQLKAMSLPSVARYIYSFNTATLLTLPLFFYNVCFQTKPWWFNGLLLVSSLSSPLGGVQSADRTEATFYMMMMVYCLVFFGPYLSKKFKRLLILIGVPLFAIIVSYLVAVSVARFDNRSEGASGSAVAYAGQGYLNFCFFWEKAKTDQLAFERAFPFLSHSLLKIDNTDERRDERSGHQGFFMSVFATYLGDLYLDLGLGGMLMWMAVYFFLAVMVIKSPRRQEMHIGECLAIFVLAAIPIFGVFYYRYMTRYYTFMNILVFVVYMTCVLQEKLARLQNKTGGKC